ncbi:DUF4406 domain-containing protein [Hydrogenophaga atypica]|uniref:DUF4406 domain-containing protein n=1 Tax=Hydrogenophaga atypica TaxID=249409 RepID=A0ABW2QH14_9BURK
MSHPASTVQLTLRDTPTGAVAVHSTFKPAVGHPATPAQSLALDMLRRSPREWPVDFADAEPTPGQSRTPRIYISGPITNVADHNRPAFNLAAQALRTAGWQVFNPAENGVPDEAPWAEHLRVDIKHLMDCTHVATLDGWQNSRGATLEVRVATQLGMQVSSLQHWLSQATEEARATEAAA